MKTINTTIHNIDNATDTAPCGIVVNRMDGHDWLQTDDLLNADKYVHGHDDLKLCYECWFDIVTQI